MSGRGRGRGRGKLPFSSNEFNKFSKPTIPTTGNGRSGRRGVRRGGGTRGRGGFSRRGGFAESRKDRNNRLKSFRRRRQAEAVALKSEEDAVFLLREKAGSVRTCILESSS